MRQAEYGSDLMADMLRILGIDYVAINPGATFQGLHDSIVNYAGNRKPEIILCCHEEIAVSLAQGYAKAAGKPMAAIVHDVVGLLHATMAIYLSWLDQDPVLVLGGTGPMAYEKRRPWIDWIHTALVQGNAVRDYTKWDDQPASLPSVVDSFLRAYRIAITPPQGPVYLCLDAALQEEKLSHPLVIPDPQRFAPPSPPQADPAALEKAAELLVEAEHPVVLADFLGRNPQAVWSLVELAELLALPVIDCGARYNFPNTHLLDLTGAEEELLPEADLILALDMRDLFQALTKTDQTTRLARYLVPEKAKIIHITLQDMAVKSWSHYLGRLQPVDLALCADTSLALPALLTLCKEKIAPKGRAKYDKRFAILSQKRDALQRKWQETAAQRWEQKPVSLARLAGELWEVIKDEDWAIVNGSLQGWPRRLWQWDKPYRYLGSGSGGLGYGVARSLGAALAYGAQNRLCIDLQPDGDFLYIPSALWTAAHYRIPLLIVMFNNRSYYNTELHQSTVARFRGRPVENKGIGTQLTDPPVDFAQLARSFSLYGEGPIEDPTHLKPALKRAVQYVKQEKGCALVDIVTQPR